MLDDIEAALQLFETNPHDHAFRTHSLSGELSGCWACSAGYDCRIVFEFVRPAKSNATEIHLLNIGSRDEVY